MTTSRKTPSRPRRRRETMAEKLDRLLAAPAGTPMKFTKREAIAMWHKLAALPPDTETPPGDEVIKRFYGLWPEPYDDDTLD